MFRWALSQDIVEIDPTAGLKAYDPGTPRDRVLTVEEIGALWKWIDSDALPRNPADILKLELLIGARCGEISGLCVEEIDRDEWIWSTIEKQAAARYAASWGGSTDRRDATFHRLIGGSDATN